MWGLKLFHVFGFILVNALSYALLVAGLCYGQEFFAQNSLFMNPQTFDDIRLRDYISLNADYKTCLELAAYIQLAGMVFMLSPFGSMFRPSLPPLRRMSEREAGVIQPILDGILEQYRAKNKGRLKKVRVMICDDPEENAFAFGKNLIVLTSGFFRKYRYNRAVCEGILAHELSHLHYRDSSAFHTIEAGFGIWPVFNVFIKPVLRLFRFMLGVNIVFAPFVILIIFIAVPVLMFGSILGLASVCGAEFLRWFLRGAESLFSQGQEYRADKFAADLIGCRGMILFFEALCDVEKDTTAGFLAHYVRSHPPSEFRIEALQKHESYVGEQLIFAGG